MRNFHIYGIADTSKLSCYFQIGETQNLKSAVFQITCPDKIILLLFRIIVLRTIQFDHQLRLVTVEIHNVVANFILPAELKVVMSKEVIPKKVFFLRLVFFSISEKGVSDFCFVPWPVPSCRSCSGERRLSPFLIHRFAVPLPLGGRYCGFAA